MLIPNIEIMKLATYYKTDENRFCRLLSLDEEDLSNYEKIFFFSESHTIPDVPKNFLKANNVIYGGTAFTNGQYVPFNNSIIDFTIPRPNIYKESLKQKYENGVKAKVISHTLDDSYYRCYAGKIRLPIPPIRPKKRVILYDREFFYPDWKEILTKISEKKPASILRIHPIVCYKLSQFFEVRNFPKLKRDNDIILDLNIPLDQVHFMINKYKNYLLADITANSNVYIQLGGTYATNIQYFKDMIYKMNLLYCYWSRQIPIKVKYEPPLIGYKNPLSNLSKKIESWSHVEIIKNREATINDRIELKKNKLYSNERDLLLKLYPTAKDLFNQNYNNIIQGGRWRI